jgi:hypothetical protein
MEPIQPGTTEGTGSPFRRPPRPISPFPRPSGRAFGLVPAAPGTAVTARSLSAAGPAAGLERTALERRRQSGARWFYWVAGLSLVNTLVALTGQRWRFIVGLGITQVADALAARSGHGMSIVSLIDLAFVVGFVLLARFAQRGRRWAFAVGATFYALDGLIFLAARDWVGVAFHAFVVVMTIRGLDAARRLT